MARSLPPLNALKAFEAAGRHLSFTKAAGELNVTPAAVSHQVKGLEELLGVPLFRREGRGLRLTDAGQAALPDFWQGFDNLADGVSRIRAHRDSSVLTISTSPSFGSMWLVPRLERFRRLHPDHEIRIDGTDRLADFERDNVDVALRYGPGRYQGVRVDHLFSPSNAPVCSPELLTGDVPLRCPNDLRHHTLLHIEWKDAEASWRMWLLAAGITDIDPGRGPTFTQEDMALQAALDGQGVALVSDVLVSDHLAAGRLVRLFDPQLSPPLTFSYYLLSRKNSGQPKVTAFRKWLLEEARSESVTP